MNDILFTYILWSLMIGMCYFYYWNRHQKPKELKTALRSRQIVIYILVFIMGVVFSPIAAIELSYQSFKNDNKNNGGLKK